MKAICFFACVCCVALNFACKEENAPCLKAAMHYRFIGFAPSELDTVILKRYQKNTTTFIDSFFYGDTLTIKYATFHDTSILITRPQNSLLESIYDYKIILPGASKTFTISDIVEPQKFGKKENVLGNQGQVDCVNDVTSYKIDGVTKTDILFGNVIYLRR